jgi:hypothetical protein
MQLLVREIAGTRRDYINRGATMKTKPLALVLLSYAASRAFALIAFNNAAMFRRCAMASAL